MELMAAFSDASFWVALGSIMVANILLSGDNAVVIALASRNLPPKQQKTAIFWGSAAAIILRVVLTINLSNVKNKSPNCLKLFFVV